MSSGRRRELSGLIVSNPLLAPARLSLVVRAAAAVLAHLAPSVAVKTGLDAAAISRDPAVVQQYRDDPPSCTAPARRV